MNTSPGPSLYNQNSLNDEDFINNFVARHEVLKVLLRCVQAHEPSHHIFIGPRGMGKTSLLRRLEIAINRDSELAQRYIPLTFREEQYNVLTLNDFWRNCGEALAEWAESTGMTEFAAYLDNAMSGEAWLARNHPADQLQTELAKLQRRPVLLIDNLDLILDSLTEQEHWEFRRYLQDRTGPVVIGAATQILKYSADRDAAFYEFFQPHYLEPLDEKETENCIRALATKRGELGQHVTQVLNNQPERLSVLHTLTGGNPRILVLIYRLLESAESEEVMADLEVLLDQVTPYYKSRVEEYHTPQQRAVIDAIALNWDPITTGELSKITKIPVTTLPALLAKLRKSGFIETIDTSGSYAGHQLVERFLNIWYLMRHGTRRAKQKMRWLVSFLTNFYTSNQLVELKKRSLSNGLIKNWHKDYALAFEEAISYERDDSNFTGGVDICNGELQIARHLSVEAAQYWKEGNLQKALNGLETIINRFIDSKVLELKVIVSRALFNKGVTEGRLGNSLAEKDTYDTLIDRFLTAEEEVLKEPVFRAIFNKGVCYGNVGDLTSAIATYDTLIELLPETKAPALLEPIAWAVYSKGLALRRLGDSSGALEMYNVMISNFENVKGAVFEQLIANSLLNKAVRLGDLGDAEGELAVYNNLIMRFQGREEQELMLQVAKAMFNKGVVLGQQGNGAAEASMYDMVCERFTNEESVELQILLASTMLNKAINRWEMGFINESISTFDTLIARYSSSDEPAVQEQVAEAMLNKGLLLSDIGDEVAELASYNNLIATFSSATDTTLIQLVARAMMLKAIIIGLQGNKADEIELYENACELLLRDPTLTSSKVSAEIKIRLANGVLDSQSNFKRAEKLLQEAAVLEPILAKANLVWLYIITGRFPEAIKLRQDLHEMPVYGLILIDVALELIQSNFGNATSHFAKIFTDELNIGDMDFSDDFDRLLRFFDQCGYGEQLIAWFEEKAFADRFAPIYFALKAYVRGDRQLLDANPEVRKPASIIYSRLDAVRHRKVVAHGKKGSGKRKK